MRHRKISSSLGRNSSHRKAMLRNMGKSFIMHGRISTTVAKAKELKRFVEPLITLAKEDSVQSRRRAVKLLAVRFNTLSPKQARAVKGGDDKSHNDDRRIIKILFESLGPRYMERPGGYTRIVKTKARVGDAAPLCILEAVE